jgi:uncharacterized membrane protein YtjA (UPF0391 family)
MSLSMPITYLILAITTGVLEFGVVTGAAAWIAKAAFFIFLVALGVALVMTGQSSYHNNTRSSH